jgi:hypothetical protein
MRLYNSKITLQNNERGIWDLDTIKGCKSGLEYTTGGCYGDCYANKTAQRYGIDFGNSVKRYFQGYAHLNSIIKKIEKIDMPFIRIGCSGDPSEDWEHTIGIISKLRNKSQLPLFDFESGKQIVIITRHWNQLTGTQIKQLSKFNLVVNTSISALDDEFTINKMLYEYNRLKPYCKSCLRIVTADFNEENIEGGNRAEIQRKLLRNENVIDTVFRPSKKNQFVINGIVNVKKMKFMNSLQLLSKYNKKTFIGKCSACTEMCGVNKLAL